ncbi:MAG: methyltransferase domain-containing protein [Rhodothermales bacterium]|nr:methyltransferase domain-containing protein [Rhodothermales bacterium]
MKVNTNAWNRLRYNFYAPVYDLIARPLVSGRKRSIQLLDLQPDSDVLIVGAGTGLDFPLLPRTAHILAIDLSPNMLQRASERAVRLGLDADCRVMNAEVLDLPDESFDAVILHLVLAVVPDPGACIREATRVLKSAGRIAIFDKFLSDESSPSLPRRVLGMLTNTLFSDINRRLGPLLAHGSLEILTKEPSILSGAYVVVVAGKMGYRQ